MIIKCRKRIDSSTAVCFDGSSSGVGDIKRWLNTGVYNESEVRTRNLGSSIIIPTEHGSVNLIRGDYVVRDVRGTINVYKADAFEKLYDVVDY